MTTKKLGSQTAVLANPPSLAGHANVVGKKEKIILKIEEKFGFEFTNEELTLNDVNCIREMASFVMSHK